MSDKYKLCADLVDDMKGCIRILNARPESVRVLDNLSAMVDEYRGIVSTPEPVIEAEGESWTKASFIEYLRDTLIPDLKESGMECTAADFERCIKFMEN